MNAQPSHDSRRLDWFGLCAAPLAWAAQLMLGWWIAGSRCPGLGVATVAPVGARGLQLAIGAVALLIAIAGFVTGLRGWRRLRQPGVHRIQAHDRAQFIAVCSLLVSAVFALGIVWATLATALLPVCEAVR